MEDKFIWSEEYSVQNREIDAQHQTFLDIANDLIDLVESGSTDRAALLERTARLGNYAMYHLSTEEEMFEIYGYPEAAEHIILHNAFRDEAKKLIDEARNEEGDESEEARRAADFCGNWLIKHILVVDKKYAQFFVDKGLK